MTRARSVAWLVAALAVVSLPQGASGRALVSGPSIDARCNSSSCSTGWYRSNVTLTWNIVAQPGTTLTGTNGCNIATVSSDTSGAAFSCSATDSNNATLTVSVTIKRDGTPPSASGGTARGPDAGGWYNHPVGVAFAGTDATSGIASCASTTYSGPDGANATSSGTCTDQAGNVSAPSSVTLSYDATPPTVNAQLDRSADRGGWYNHPVGYSASGSDGLSGIASCSSGTYAGPDVKGGAIGATCSDKAGNVGRAPFAMNYDVTPPSVSAASFGRPADIDGWYNHPVQVSFSGADATSGVASCTSLNYSGPDKPEASLGGSCTDAAGNVGTGGSVSFKYDSTPPKLSNVAVTASARLVSLSWAASADTTTVQIARAPGASGSAPSTVFTGRGSRFVDHAVTNHVRYQYTLTATDQAANNAVQTLTVVPAAALYSPARDAVVHAPPRLAWRSVTGADYYNVQLYRKGKKILSAWPASPNYRLATRWHFGGRVYRLSPGRYNWLVWPGRGRRSAHRYGRLVGQSVFVVRR